MLVTSGVSWADTVLATDAVDDNATVAQDSVANSIDVLGNDAVVEGGALVITEVGQGANGSVVISSDSTSLTYEPGLDFCGPESFTYTVSDGLFGTDTATVAVEVTCELADDETTTVTAAPVEETTTTTAAPVEETTTTTAASVEETTTTTTTVPSVPTLDLSTASTLIVKLVAGLSQEEQAAVIVSHGGVETAVIDVLRLHMVAVAPEAVEGSIAAFAADPAVVSVDVDLPRTAEAVPNDPGYADQWALPLIGWEEVYGVVAPLGSSTIAVLDTGVDAANPDLAGRVVSGWSFDGTDPTTDASGHGTHVATIAAANDDDGTGIAGVAYAGVNIMPVRVLGDDGTGQDSDIITGLVWAVENGADVVLMAFSNPGESAALQFAVDYAWANGVVLVAAAGNDGGSAPTYPAGLARVVGVGATDSSDAVWAGSNQSNAVFMVAPGVGITSSIGTVTGTSASAAVVAGAAALIQANDSSASPSVIVGRLARNAEAVDGVAGNGRLHLGRALIDESTEGVTPAGAPGGGPIVGPYVASVVQTGTLTLLEADCATPKLTFVLGDAICARGEVTGVSGASANSFRIQWFRNSIGALNLVRSTLFSGLVNGSVRTDTFTPDTATPWVVVLCRQEQSNSCASGQQLDTKTFTVSAAAELTLAKSANPTTFTAASEAITYTYEVTNSGDVALAGPVTVIDDRATVTCPDVDTVGNNDEFLDPDESITCTASYTITAADVTAKSVTNTATATADGTDSNEAQVTVNLRALSLVKSASPTTYTAAGQVIGYSYLVTNIGNVGIAGPITVGDDKSTDETCPDVDTVGNNDEFLDPSESITCTASYTITQPDLDNGSVTNTAFASGGSPTTTSNAGTATVSAIQVAELTLTKDGTYQGDLGRAEVGD
ncbi:MAG: S8 family serine peptidase, partial [Acidimicrobiia bacterium]